KIADLPGLGLQLQWSPDARRIRFVLAQDGQPGTTLWEVGLGGSPQPILKGWDGEGQIASPGGWSPDGRNSFFVSPHLGTYDIWDLPEQSIFNFGKRYPSRISDVPFVIMGIVPSRDGKKLFAIGIHTMPEVGRFDPRVGQFLPYQEFSGIHAYWITFSRNHRQVAYTTYPEENLWIENADGTDRTQLTFAPLHVVGLSWSPDGSRIAFRAQTPGGHWKVYVMSVSGKELRELTAGQSDSGVPTWSPDGRRLVFGDMPAVWGQARGDEVLHLYDLRSGTTSALSGSGGLWTSRWSPDGKFIAALKISNQELMLYDCHSGRWRSLGPAGLNEVMWSHDSKFLMYETLRPDVAIYRIQIANGKTERLCDLAAYARLEQGFTLDSDDHPIVLQNKSTSEIYAFGIESH
ncbi:MAG TPA: hypothetical protein VFO34_12340, partial [Candidatus Acidoferrales bacterium]|nr:hypothetical protein [Candidatus Acidoferrales bacterium]